MYSFAVQPVHGLGMSPEEFWASTPREFASRRKVRERDREHSMSMYAGLQATLHNANFRTEKSQPVFTAEMFMPGYEPPKQDRSFRRFRDMAEMQRKPTQEETAILYSNAQEFEERQSRAAAAKAQGATGELVIRIMEGRG